MKFNPKYKHLSKKYPMIIKKNPPPLTEFIKNKLGINNNPPDEQFTFG